MKHIQLEITANDYQQEELIALLDDFDPSGFEQTEESLVAYFDESSFQKNEVLRVVEGYRFRLTELEEKNWNEVWEQNFQPVVVENFCAVRAHFHEPISGVEYEILITPKMSFGTGHHATTYMMMQQMRRLDFNGKAVFDFGTGTGILAILAEKLGATAVIAIDVDEWSINNAEENFAQNDCNKIAVSLTSQLPSGRFDIILANINRHVILGYLESLVGLVKEGGLILFSGLLVADEEVILTTALTYGLTSVKRLERQGWISLLLQKSTMNPV